VEQPSLNGDRKPPRDPAGGDTTTLAAVCWAAGTLLAQAPGPVTRLRVRSGEVSVDMRWTAPAGVAAPPPAPAPAASAAPADGEAGHPEGAELAYVRAPMVGTFYHAPSPDAPPFVKVGDVVEAGQQIGIVEAMKLMNAVEAEQPGRVIEIVVGNAAAVEFDQPLVAVAPLGTDGQPVEEQPCSPPY
jgi:acetyl-CoA carboxylase biotin carboxyl carrier protein